MRGNPFATHFCCRVSTFGTLIAKPSAVFEGQHVELQR